MFKKKFIKDLISIGLTKKQSLVYIALLNNDKITTSVLLKKINNIFTNEEHIIDNKNINKILKTLISLNLISFEKNTGYLATLNPTNLKELKTKKKISIQNLNKIIKNLESKFLLLKKRSEIIFLQGEIGIDIISDDMLSSKTDIKVFANPNLETNKENIIENNESYFKERRRRKILKKIILFKTTKSLNFLNKKNNSFTSIKITKNKAKSDIFTFMYIYDNKIVYINYLYGNKITLVIINDTNIYNINREIFDIE